MVLLFLFANLGRGTAEQARRSWQRLAQVALDRDVDVVAVVEVDEGDKGYSDRRLLRRFFTRRFWRQLLLATKEPLLVRRDLRVERPTSELAAHGVPHQSPARRVNADRVLSEEPGVPNTTVVVTHYAAGYKNGHRSRRVKFLLGISWRRTFRAHRRTVRRAHRQGDNVVTFFDGNDRGFDVKDLHEDAVLLFRDGPDLGAAIPAEGFVVEDHVEERVRTFIERLHQGHLCRVRFAPRRRR